jgi:hypothetical protein
MQGLGRCPPFQKKKMMASMCLEVPFPLEARSLRWAKAWNAISVHSFYLSSFEMGNSLHLAPKQI